MKIVHSSLSTGRKSRYHLYKLAVQDQPVLHFLQEKTGNLRREVYLFQTRMDKITVNVSLYGSIAKRAGGCHVAQFDYKLEPGSSKADLLAQLGISEDERGFLFINSVLHEVPGLSTGGREPLQDGDHIGIFSITYMWPYQYRDGVRMSESLTKALQEHGPMHHTYSNTPGEP